MSIFVDASFAGLEERVGLGKKREAPVRLLRGEYLVGLWEAGRTLQRRQDIEESSFFDEPLCQEGTRLIVMSYRWQTKHHPDPDGFSLATMAAVIKAYLVCVHRIAVFLDFSSLYQTPRSEGETMLFKAGLKAINVLYAHQVTHVWCLTRVPQGTTPYHASGWCTFERTIASVLTEQNKLWDLGKLPEGYVGDFVAQLATCREARDPLAEERFLFQVFTAMSSWCTAARADRAPPLRGDRFRALLSGKAFTNGKADHELVAGLYDAFLSEGLGCATSLAFSDLEWGDAEVAQLADVLPLCTALRELSLSNNSFGDGGIGSLARALPLTLTSLDLGNMPHVTDVGAAALVMRLPPSVTALSLLASPLTCPLTVARSRGDIERLRRFYSGDATERSAVIAECEAERAERVARAATGPAQVTLDGGGGNGLRVWRQLRCKLGALERDEAVLGIELWQPVVAGGLWVLSEDTPLLEGAPHYELNDEAAHATLHLFRKDRGPSYVKRCGRAAARYRTVPRRAQATQGRGRLSTPPLRLCCRDPRSRVPARGRDGQPSLTYMTYITYMTYRT